MFTGRRRSGTVEEAHAVGLVDGQHGEAERAVGLHRLQPDHAVVALSARVTSSP